MHDAGQHDAGQHDAGQHDAGRYVTTLLDVSDACRCHATQRRHDHANMEFSVWHASQWYDH